MAVDERGSNTVRNRAFDCNCRVSTAVGPSLSTIASELDFRVLF